ncbi:carbohydrate sulfotransferase 9-like [Spea bombifrons]|uniref:carbohydrate sulfotransferase 9-like n=1 Tax=Spea bombifrons TaxID=233779 RepID=UPI00234966E7|nr:carbohydrate sulfotransferase 9-like [Spea bombifrons]
MMSSCHVGAVAIFPITVALHVFPDADPILKDQRSRQRILETSCRQRNLTNPSKRITSFLSNRLFVEPRHKFIFCEVPKVGCSNWKRVMFLLTTNLSTKAEHIQHDAIHQTRLLKRLSNFPPEQQQMMLRNYTKVMFTRDPLQRIVSAYRDKFLHSAGYYATIANTIKSRFRESVNSEDAVTFQEFARYVLGENPRRMDIHWMPMHYLCDPCNVNYTILGKFETLKRDADYVLKTIGAPSDISYPTIKRYNESRTDASVSGEYFASLPPGLLERLFRLYKLDFELFDY